MIDYPSAEAERGFVAELLDGKSGDTLDISSVRRDLRWRSSPPFKSPQA